METAIPPSPEQPPSDVSVSFLRRLEQGVKKYWKEGVFRTVELLSLVPVGTTAGLAIEKIIHTGPDPNAIGIAIANTLAVLAGAAVFEVQHQTIVPPPNAPIS
jgi:hypothetical protein